MSYPDTSIDVRLSVENPYQLELSQMQPASYADHVNGGRHVNQCIALTREAAAILAAQLLHFVATGRVPMLGRG